MRHVPWYLLLSLVALSYVGAQTTREFLKYFESHERSDEARLPQAGRGFVPPISFSATTFTTVKVNQYPTTEPQNEPSVQVNPQNRNNIVAAYRDFQYGSNPPIRNVGIAATVDGGLTWHETLAQYGDHNRFTDPAVGVDAEGNFYVSTIDYNSQIFDGAITVRKSTDGGLTWKPAVPVILYPTNSLDKDMMYVDDCPTSPYQGTIYVVWSHFGSHYAVSYDTGRNFYSPSELTGHYEPGIWLTPTTGPDGELYIAGSYGDSIRVIKSANAGLTFDQSSSLYDYQLTSYTLNGGVLVTSEPVPSVDKSETLRRGTIYVTWTGDRYGDADIFCSRSSDGGQTWGAAVRVNNDSTGNGRDQFKPWSTVDDSGWIDVVFLDRRNDPANIFCDAYFAQSRDGGHTFKNYRITSQNFDPRINYNSDVRFGDYIGIAAAQGRITPIWTDSHLGNQDVFITNVDLNSLTGSISGTVFNDCNGNGVRNAGDHGVGNWTAIISDSNGSETTQTNSTGVYSFNSLFPGMYAVRIDTEGHWMQTTPVSPTSYTLTVDSSNVSGRDFGIQSDAPFPVINDWNLISVPRITSDPRTNVIYPSAVSSVFTYNQGYVKRDTILVGTGYWLKFPDANCLFVPGDSLFLDSVGVAAGWNMIGSITVAIPSSSIMSDPPGIVTSQFFSFDGRNYIEALTIEPGKGYWVKVSGSGKLILSSISSVAHSARITIVPTSERPPTPPSDETGTNPRAIIPNEFALEQNYPNPFNPETHFRFSTSDFGLVTLRVYDVLGREVATIVNENLRPGEYTRTWDAGSLPSGVYYYRLTAGSPSTGSGRRVTETNKMLFIR